MILNLDDKIKYFFNTKTLRDDKIIISLSGLIYFIWLFAFPLFGPILLHLFSGMRALVIDQGRFMQFFLFTMLLSGVSTGYLWDHIGKKSLMIWLSALAAASVTLGCIFFTEISDSSLFSALLGIISGINLPVIGAFFSDRTSPEDRGRIIGLPVGLSFLFAYLFYVGVPYSGYSVKTEFVLVSVIFLVTLVTFFVKPSKVVETVKRRRETRFKRRQIVYYAVIVFLFYWVAGILFSIFIPSILDHISRVGFYLAWALTFMLGAFVAGSMYDSMGRSFPAILGLAITGVSLAIFVVFGLSTSWLYLVILSAGVSFSIVFSFLVWADLAPSDQRGLFYGCGVGLMSLAMLIGLVSTGSIFGSVSESYVKSYILYSAMALFLCIPLLIVAEELLPKELIEQRRFQEYLEHAKKRYINPD